MIIDNSFKIGLNKAGLIWRILIYQILTMIIVFGICLACCYPLLAHLSDSGFFGKVGDFIVNNFYNFNFSDFLMKFRELLFEFWGILSSDISLLHYAILFVSITVVLGSFLFALMEIPICECVYGFMGSYTKLNFFGCFISNFWKSTKYWFLKLLTEVVFDLAIMVGFIAGLWLFGISSILNVFVPLILIVGIVLLISIKKSLFGLWIPGIVTNNAKVLRSLGTSLKLFWKNFKTVFGLTLMCVLVAFAINYGLSVLTCGVGLFLSLPATILFFTVFYNVMFFQFYGLKYYLDTDKIITPKKREDMEKIKDIKEIV